MRRAETGLRILKAAQVCAEDTHLLLVALTEVVAAVQEAVPTHDPLLLDKALETENGSTVGVHHHLHQRRNEAAEVGGVVLCGGWGGGLPGNSAGRKEGTKCYKSYGGCRRRQGPHTYIYPGSQVLIPKKAGPLVAGGNVFSLRD